MSPARICVYCGQGKDLTDEHIFPDCFQKRFEAISIAKTPAGEKPIRSALKIHDVCASCNSGPLSILDTYLCTLTDKYFSGIVNSGDKVRFQYDFDLLLRMLLKTGYNVARVRKWPCKRWQDAAQYIVGKPSCPSGFRIFLQLLIPTPVKKTNVSVSPGTIEVPPLPMNIYQMDVSSFPGFISGYWVSIWSYRFFVLQEDLGATGRVRKLTVATWLKTTKGAGELTSRGVKVMYASSVEFLDTVKDNSVFHNQLSQARMLKAVIESKTSK